jgi:uncharacterized protein (DUF305 family)
MNKWSLRFAVFLTIAISTGCSSARAGGPVTGGAQPIPQSRPVYDADVNFFSGMIPHHAQAVKIAKWAPTHGASDAVKRMCERIVVAQTDEIVIMQNWLIDRGKPAPPADATHMVHMQGGVEHKMLMPGMLTDEELANLDKARGVEFDRLFLTYMIKHHNGAVGMVDELFKQYGGGQDETVFKMASDIYADQTTEVGRMQGMLDALPGRKP